MSDMEIKTKVILECLEEELNKLAEENISRVVTINKLNNRIEYNISAKAYDFIYGLTIGDFDTSDTIKILDGLNVAYEYQGNERNRSGRFLVEGFQTIIK